MPFVCSLTFPVPTSKSENKVAQITTTIQGLRRAWEAARSEAAGFGLAVKWFGGSGRVELNLIPEPLSLGLQGKRVLSVRT